MTVSQEARFGYSCNGHGIWMDWSSCERIVHDFPILKLSFFTCAKLGNSFFEGNTNKDAEEWRCIDSVSVELHSCRLISTTTVLNGYHDWITVIVWTCKHTKSYVNLLRQYFAFVHNSKPWLFQNIIEHLQHLAHIFLFYSIEALKAPITLWFPWRVCVGYATFSKIKEVQSPGELYSTTLLGPCTGSPLPAASGCLSLTSHLSLSC